MNVFVLCTGRCGSTTFARACRHIGNYSAGHESRSRLLGEERLRYPPRHIEVDNRLAWLLGRLDEAYGDEAFYVHLVREQQGTAESFHRRWNVRAGIIRAYAHGILMRREQDLDACLDLWTTVHANIRLFLKDKTHALRFDLAHAARDFETFWRRIGAEGNYAAAQAEWTIRHNASRS